MIEAFALSGLLGGAILLVLAARARHILRQERGLRPGSPPGQGHHAMRSEYFSGGGGGGEARDYSIPKDPQEYAQLFVPKTSEKKDR